MSAAIIEQTTQMKIYDGILIRGPKAKAGGTADIVF